MKKLITLLALASLVLVRASAQEAYAVYADNTLTFYYDTEKNSRSGKVFALADATANGPAWYSDVRATRDKRIIVTRVIFHSSFAAARPTTTYRWFAYLEDLQQIDGLQHLNTADVRKMSEMFGYCSSLTSLDLSGFNTDKVTDMSLMFSGCSSLESLNLSSFNTANVTNMAGMFNGCRQLASLDLSGFNTAKVTSI
ncbi:MAG: BspA family leucine-rich repeat surface protein, partial [Alloprevotella sp.]|nr:BspA family leucine-rich repeat surface protein [Alloprevotella sp.]